MKNIIFLLIFSLISTELFCMNAPAIKAFEIPYGYRIAAKLPAGFSFKYKGQLPPSINRERADEVAKFLSQELLNDNEQVFWPYTDEQLNNFRNCYGENIFERAVREKKRNVARYILRQRSFLSMQNTANEMFHPLLHDQLNRRPSNMDIYLEYIQHIKANPFLATMKDKDGMSVLHWSTYHGYTLLISLLIKDVPALLSLQDKTGRTALHLALAKRDLEIARKIISAAMETQQSFALSKADSQGATALHWTLMLLATAPTFMFVDEISSFNADRCTGLYASTYADIAKLLSSQSELMNISDNYGETPAAIESWCLNMHELMKDTSLTKERANILHLTVMRKDEEGALRLLRYFPKLLSKKTIAGNSPLDLAKQFADDSMKNFITQASIIQAHWPKKTHRQIHPKASFGAQPFSSANTFAYQPVLLAQSPPQNRSLWEDNNDVMMDLSEILDLPPFLLEKPPTSLLGVTALSAPQVMLPQRENNHVDIDLDGKIKKPVILKSKPELGFKRKHAAILANSFILDEHQTFRTPYLSHAKRIKPTSFVIPFVRVRFGDEKLAVKVAPIATQQLNGSYLTLHNALPNAEERVTMVLAGRGANASIPVETAGGRVILVLAGEKEALLANKMLDEHVDVFITHSLSFQGKNLTPMELTLFNSRRIAAFELASFLPFRREIAVLDDNIDRINASENIWVEKNLAGGWPSFYGAFAAKTRQYACIGFKQSRPTDEHDSVDAPEIKILPHSKTGWENGFGQKMFFFNLLNVFEAASFKIENLFPPHIKLAQEDIFFQMFLALANKQVGHVARHSVVFDRMNATSVAKKKAIKSEEWFKIRTDFEKNKVRKETIEQIKTYVAEALETSTRKRKRQIETPLPSYFREVVERDENQVALADSEDEKQEVDDEAIAFAAELDAELEKDRACAKSVDSSTNPGKRKTKRSRVERDAARLEHIKKFDFHFAELDNNTAWEEYATVLQEIKRTKLKLYPEWKALSYLSRSQMDTLLLLRPYQRLALRRLGQRLQSGSRLGHMKLPTGTGKTEIFFQAVHLAGSSLKGNIAIILPNLNIESQTFERLKAFVAQLQKSGDAVDLRHLSNASSIGSRDVSAHLASVNEPLLQGGQLVLFCEKSFPLFVERRLGNLSDFSMLIFDELHKIEDASKLYIRELSSKKSGLILGFSATPGRKAKAFGGSNGRIFHFSSRRAVSKNWLVPWETRVTKGSNSPEQFSNDFLALLSSENHPNGGKLSEKQGIVYTRFQINDVEQIALTLTRAGYAAEAYHSRSQNPQAILERYKKGQTKILIAIGTLREGFDAPVVDYVFINQAHPQRKDVIQMRGRALRPREPGKIALIFVINEETACIAKACGRDEKSED